jgi:putative ABC transport system permease protein
LKGVVANNLQSGFSFRLRKGLVVFQFVISAFLVIASLVVIKQISYMFDKPLGFNKENIMNLPAMNLNEGILNNIRTSLKDNPSIIDISATSATPGKRVILGGIRFPGQSQMSSLRTMFVDYNYLKTMQVGLVNGRDFNKTISSDSTTNIIVNEAAAKSFNLKNPIGNNVWLLYYNTSKQATIIGIAKDFHQGSLHNAIEPTIFVIEPIYYSMMIRFKGDPEKVKQDLSAVWGKYFPNELFTYTLLDDDLKKLYKSESTFKNILLIFTVLAILIASLGLFGLIYFSNALRRKEIGVRKVLGAANGKIAYLLSKEYIILIAISLIISIPLSNYALNKWLENFAYRTDVSIASYFIGTLITLIISLCTVLLQGLKSALANPIKSLRTE